MQTVIGAFDSQAQARKAKEHLVREGFDRDDVCVEPEEAATDVVSGAGRGDARAGDGPQGRVARFFAQLFGTGDMHRHHSETYQEAVRRGGYVVVVDADDDGEAENAAICLHEAGAINVDERMELWRNEGWTGGQPVHAGGTASAPGGQGRLDVAGEPRAAGTGAFQHGGVRVVQRTAEPPLREVLRLRNEPVGVGH